MADPSPPAGLPNNEWIELKNISGRAINLAGCRIADASGQSGPMSSFLLQADSLLIICSSGSLASMSSFGQAISVTSFPSLDNDGDDVILKSAAGNVIHAVQYSSSWYNNELKKEGGWTLEMIDPGLPCRAMENWTASNDLRGGTPGKKNAASAVVSDTDPPGLLRAYAIDSLTLVAVFDEPLDSARVSNPSNYLLDGNAIIMQAVALPPVFNQVQLKLNTQMHPGKIYFLSAQQLRDCRQNQMSQSQVKTGLAMNADTGDLVVNEILFDPRSNAYDYVEIYNKGNKIVDLSTLYMANRNGQGIISSAKILYPARYNIYPGEYFVMTEDPRNLAVNYTVKDPARIFSLSLPSFPDDAGEVVLLNAQGKLLDEVDYDVHWQFKLLANPEGVALERIDPARPSQDSANWHSAASTAGFGTPGYRNSQFMESSIPGATISVNQVFSPDNDGFEDIAAIKYSVERPGYVGNIIIFNMQGLAVRQLVHNGIMGLQGQWNWDGLDEKGAALPMGPYVVFSSFFNLEGKKKNFKNVIVLARRM